MQECEARLHHPLPSGAKPLDVISRFKQAVNMSIPELEAHLASEASRAGTDADQDHEGRHMARRVVELLQKDDGTGELYYEADFTSMHQIAEYVECHRREVAQQGEALDELLRCRLMNYGCDPTRA